MSQFLLRFPPPRVDAEPSPAGTPALHRPIPPPPVPASPVATDCHLNPLPSPGLHPSSVGGISVPPFGSEFRDPLDHRLFGIELDEEDESSFETSLDLSLDSDFENERREEEGEMPFFRPAPHSPSFDPVDPRVLYRANACRYNVDDDLDPLTGDGQPLGNLFFESMIGKWKIGKHPIIAPYGLVLSERGERGPRINLRLAILGKFCTAHLLSPKFFLQRTGQVTKYGTPELEMYPLQAVRFSERSAPEPHALPGWMPDDSPASFFEVNYRLPNLPSRARLALFRVICLIPCENAGDLRGIGLSYSVTNTKNSQGSKAFGRSFMPVLPTLFFDVDQFWRLYLRQGGISEGGGDGLMDDDDDDDRLDSSGDGPSILPEYASSNSHDPGAFVAPTDDTLLSNRFCLLVFILVALLLLLPLVGNFQLSSPVPDLVEPEIDHITDNVTFFIASEENWSHRGSPDLQNGSGFSRHPHETVAFPSRCCLGCVCYDGWNGTFCDYGQVVDECSPFYCFNVSSLSELACSGRGDRIGVNTCDCIHGSNTVDEECRSGHLGEDCVENDVPWWVIYLVGLAALSMLVVGGRSCVLLYRSIVVKRWRRAHRYREFVRHPFEIHEKKDLGRGRLAKLVFRVGNRNTLKREVALKTMFVPPSGPNCTVDDVRRDLEDVVGWLVHLTHDNVVQCYGCYFKEDVFHILFERMRGGNVFEWIEEAHERTGTGLDTKTKVRLLCDVAAGMKCLHSHCPPISGDLKPANLPVTEDGIVKISFGLSKLLDAVAKAKASVVGTPGYIPFSDYDFEMSETTGREEAGREEAALRDCCEAIALDSTKHDVYCFGVTAWAIWMGKEPDSDGRRDLDASYTCQPPDLGECEEMPTRLRDLIRRCLNSDPFERPFFMEISQELDVIYHSMTQKHPQYFRRSDSPALRASQTARENEFKSNHGE